MISTFRNKFRKHRKSVKYPGTPGYMAPEQLQREAFDARADIFAYGVAAYELLTNHKPYPGETPADILAAQLSSGGPVRPREHNPEIPPALESVILKCIAREPDPALSIFGYSRPRFAKCNLISKPSRAQP